MMRVQGDEPLAPGTEPPEDCSQDDSGQQKPEKKNNALALWGNERTMNLNTLILTNIQSSHYFKVNLYELKTYHEVIDEIYYKVTHLEPWEKGSRKTAGQTGMCGGVRGVGAGGIVSTAFCLLYKLFTLKLSRKQVNGLTQHPDSPYIRALGFMYIRYTQPPNELWDWFEPYLEDPEEMDVKAGSGQVMTMGEILRHFLSKLEWFSTLFPRIPVPIQQRLEKQLNERFPPTVPAPAALPPRTSKQQQRPTRDARHIPAEEVSFGEAERVSRMRRLEGDTRDVDREKDRERERERDRRERERPRERERRDDRRRSPLRGDKRYSGERDREKYQERSREREPNREKERDRERGRSKDHHSNYKDHRDRYAHRSPRDFASELAKERDRQKREKERERDRDRNRH